MSANKKIFVIIITLFLFVIPFNVSAEFILTQGDKVVVAGQGSYLSLAFEKYKDDKLVYCAQFEYDAPYECTGTKEDLYDRVHAGLYEIIKSNMNYVCKEKLITKFLYVYSSKSGRENYSLDSSEKDGNKNWVNSCKNVKTIWNNAVAAYDDFDTLRKTKVSYTKTKLNFTKDLSTGKYKASVTVDPGGYDFQCSVNLGSVSISKKNVTVTVDSSYAGQTITLTCTPEKDFKETTYYDCGGTAKQDLITHDTTTKTSKGDPNSISGSFTVAESKGSVTITKKNSVTKAEIEGVKFNIYPGSKCNDGGDVEYIKRATTNSKGTVTFSNLSPGTYSIYESTIPAGYETPSNRCTTITVSAGKETTKTIYNTPLGSIQITKKNSVTGNNMRGVEFNLYNSNGCAKENYIKRGTTNSSGIITFTNLSAGTYYIWERHVPTGYVTPTDEQRCIAVTVSAGNTETPTIYNTPLGFLEVTKTNTGGDQLAGLDPNTKAAFMLFSNSACTTAVSNEVEVNGGGIAIFNNLVPGVYYLKETKTKRGYRLPQNGEPGFCDQITITAGTKTTTSIANETECEAQFRSNMSMKERIDLYNYIEDTYSFNFNALLDINNKTAETACRNIPVEKKYDKTCLSAISTSTNASTFSNTNVSMFTEKHGNYTFCLTTYNLDNKLGKTNFGDIKSGQAIISTSDLVATATLNRVCYNYGDSLSVIPTLEYSNYVEIDASIDDIYLNKTLTSSGNVDNNTITVNYTLPEMYASNKNGKVYYGSHSCPSGEYCKPLGRGIISKFNLRPGEYNLGFNIKLTDELGTLSLNGDCTYVITNELIDFNNKMDLEFRPVNTNSDNLFLNKVSGNRNPGSNWSKEQDINTVLKVNNNSYNKNSETPLYVIKLTPSIIKKIRDHNKTNSYDDYNLTCKNDGTQCISNYLTYLRNSNVITIYNSTQRQCMEENRCE